MLKPLHWVLIIGGIVVVFLLMRKSSSGSLLGSGKKSGGFDINFNDVKGFFSGVKKFFSGDDEPGLTGSELETDDGSIDLSHIYG